MGWKDLFRKKDSDKEDLLEKYTLSNLKVGYLVDFDLKTWKVTSSSYYDWGSGDITYESDFEASTGIPVEEYQFTNILPGTDDN